MTGLSSESRSLVDAARGGDDPSASDRVRVRAAVLAQVGAVPPAGPGAGQGPGPGAAARGAMLSKSGLTKLLVVVAAAAGIGLGGAWMAARNQRSVGAVAAFPVAPAIPATPATPASLQAPAPPAAAPSTPAPAETPARRDPPRRRVAAGTPNPAPAAGTPVDPADAIRAERALLAAAHAALRRGDAAAALAALAEHATRFPHGALAEERSATRVLALCDAGQSGAATIERAGFLDRWPRSVHAARVAAACAE